MTTGAFAGLWDVVTCSNKEKYICKKPAEGVQVTTVPPTTPPLSCASGWNTITNRNACFKVREQSRSCLRTWTAVRSFLFYCFARHIDFQKVLPAQEDLEGSPGLLQGHRWGPAELTQLQRPAECPVLYLSKGFMSALLIPIHVSDQSFLSLSSFSLSKSAWIGFSLSASKGFVWSDGSAVCTTLLLP